jgi:xanthine/uracil permease
METKLSNYMTLIGLCAMAFYGVMMATGAMSLSVMPQFIISAIIFLTSGRIMKKAARRMRNSREAVAEVPLFFGIKWRSFTWPAALIALLIMILLMIKPIGVSPQDLLSKTEPSDLFYAPAVP